MPALQAISVFASMVSVVLGHGMITNPAPRKVGSAFGQVCGTQLQSVASSDPNGPAQLWSQTQAPDTPDCNLYLCKGMQYADSPTATAFTAGQVVPITVDIIAPHSGVANVSVVNTKTNSVVGAPLISWDVYASNSAPIPANQTSFSVTIPDDLNGCTEAGTCVLQWYWYAESVNQTYEACVDFTTGGSSAANSSSATPAPASSSAAASVSAATPATTLSAVIQNPTTFSTVVAPIASAPTHHFSMPLESGRPLPSLSSLPSLSLPPYPTGPTASLLSILSSLPSGVLASASALPTATAAPSGALPPFPTLPLPDTSVPMPPGTTLMDVLVWLEEMLQAMQKENK
ncbi:hypothetical protein MMC20_001989 [Loxospora ochrophaea]|nr:hypothetical protein [Loxospora ochrophaea]